MLEPKVLVNFLSEILKKAKEYNIKEVKVFGKHIGQEFEMQSGINFLIEPDPKMTVWHKRTFETSISSILDTTVETYSPTDIDNLVKETLITSDQAQNYKNQAVSLEQYVSQLTKPLTKNSSQNGSTTSKAQGFSIERLLDYLRADSEVWHEINNHPELLTDAYDKLSTRKLVVK